MAAPKGNQYWMKRINNGRDLIYKTPADLSRACSGYFKWLEDNKLEELKLMKGEGGVIEERIIPKMRAATLRGLCVHIGIHQETWRLYKSREGFIGVCARVEDIMYEQKFSGAAAELLNPAIIARDLGLADKQTIGGDPDAPLMIQETNNVALAQTLMQLLIEGQDVAELVDSDEQQG